jgi:excinuclease ABC subunit C
MIGKDDLSVYYLLHMAEYWLYNIFMSAELTATVQEKLNMLPTNPGCYLYKDEDGRIIYVGKAINLRSRVRSYFHPSANHSIKTRRLVEAVCDLDYMVTESELEALVLECNLIKKYQPYYNVRLRDDKHYPYLCLTTSDPFPRLLLTRRIRSDGSKFFGPYSSSRAVYAAMDIIKRIFPLVSCGKKFDGRPVQKPCLYYHMGQCMAPCAGYANQEDYNRTVKDVIAFLEGRQEQALKDLKAQMARASDELQFERAARLRDQVSAIEEVLARQKVISTQMTDQDVIAIVGGDGGSCVQMFYIRGGKLIGQNHFLLEGSGESETTGEAVQEFVKQYYQNAPYIPQEIILPCDIEETAIVQQWLRQKRGKKVEITVPVRGDKKRLMEMAAENASHAFELVKAEMRARMGSAERALEELAEALGLESPPKRIECYDISHFQNENFVGSMVTFIHGEANKSFYRRFKIREHENKPDDYAMMKETLIRRLKESLGEKEGFRELPDLIIVDGGRGQVNSALQAMEETRIFVRVCGLAKRFELLILPEEVDPVALPRESQALYLVQRIRDEAHRFANAYRVVLQSHKQTHSALEDIPGIGPKRRRALLRHFGSMDRIRCATIEELAQAPAMTLPAAESVAHFLRAAESE